MKNQEVPFAHIWRAPLCNFLIKSVHHHPKTWILPQCSYGPVFPQESRWKRKKRHFFNFPFFSEEPNSPFLACVSMVMVPRTVCRCSKFGSWNYQEGSVASVTPSCQSFTINRSFSCILWRWSRLEWIRVFKGEPQCISPYARTESINTSRTQKQTCWCNCLALRLSLSFQMKAPQPFFDSKSSQKKKKKKMKNNLWTQRLHGEEIHLTQCIVTL